ncbi:hypothetical protein EJ05DRAFT_72451 [Pseudovirgaria hyperparasitica]|uniref:PWWP domain-containing protein n=1 Tax=Pseudovirgaria hyperparasitica TaxID=470096 RepID=A0A6A6W6I2_9PEZI|nr:uncharacterized protein EJ05DRAFT_72451 [Pseudovirgaria hyperparasitica]KAF2756681.1 hypothetical protein EJ05DRAFT_72451 [Pseudovirgaria hyperparasitica]
MLVSLKVGLANQRSIVSTNLIVAEVATTGDTNGTATKQDVTQDNADTGSATPAPVSTPAPKNGKRKGSSGVPEHKGKKTPASKKKAPPVLHLNAKPGDLWFAIFKGHAPWPAIICDEEMLPESLLSKRPVSAARPDGSYREDFHEGQKNARDRRYPVMFLGTNEFAWLVNTDLRPLDVEEVKRIYSTEDKGKKSQSLWDAYGIAAEEHDLSWFKTMLSEHEVAIQQDIEEKEARAAEKAAKKEQAARRKSAKADDDDVEMEDAAGDSSKKNKKRKKDGDDVDDKAAKTPKKLKVNGPKTPAADSAVKPKSKKPKEKKAKAEATASPAAVELTGPERQAKTQKTVLYLRHRLQKGFLNKDTAPKAEDMDAMDSHLKQLEQHEDLEAEIIKATKIHKVLRGITKLSPVPPKDEEYNFVKRSTALMDIWNKTLESASETPVTAAPPAFTNGHKEESTAPNDKEESVPPKEEPEADETKDVIMSDAAAEEANEDEPEKTVKESTEVPAGTA